MDGGSQFYPGIAHASSRLDCCCTSLATIIVIVIVVVVVVVRQVLPQLSQTITFIQHSIHSIQLFGRVKYLCNVLPRLFDPPS